MVEYGNLIPVHRTMWTCYDGSIPHRQVLQSLGNIYRQHHTMNVLLGLCSVRTKSIYTDTCTAEAEKVVGTSNLVGTQWKLPPVMTTPGT